MTSPMLIAAPAIATAPTATAYETLRQQHLREMRGRMPAAIERLAWPAERLAAHRESKLRELLRYAQAHSAWHRRRLSGIDIATVTERSLRELPPMTKDDVMSHWSKITTDPRVTLDAAEQHLSRLTGDAYLFERYHVNASGGSSGRRGVFVNDWDAWAEGFVGMMRNLVRLQMRDPELRIASRPMVGAAIAAFDPTHMSSAMPQTFSNPATGLWHRFPVTLPFEQISACVQALQPLDLLIGYPTMLHRLALAALDGGLRIAPKFVVSVSEPLLPEILETLGDAWPATRLLNWWATTETCGVAMSCGFGPGMHLNDDTLIVEPVDAAGRPVAPGERAAKVLITNLVNHAPIPLVRYEITDEVVLLDAQCACGSAHRLIEDVQGRLDDGFCYAGGVHVHPHLFRSPLAKERGVVEYQVRQTLRGARVALVCNGDVDARRLRQRIAEHLRDAGLREPVVAIERVDAIERQVTGKLKRFVPLPAVHPAIM